MLNFLLLPEHTIARPCMSKCFCSGPMVAIECYRYLMALTILWEIFQIFRSQMVPAQRARKGQNPEGPSPAMLMPTPRTLFQLLPSAPLNTYTYYTYTILYNKCLSMSFLSKRRPDPTWQTLPNNADPGRLEWLLHAFTLKHTAAMLLNRQQQRCLLFLQGVHGVRLSMTERLGVHKQVMSMSKKMPAGVRVVWLKSTQWSIINHKGSCKFPADIA